MSHTSQRRGLQAEDPVREIIVLAMLPSAYRDDEGARAAMSQVAVKMLEHEPENWLSRNFSEIAIPRLGPAQVLIEWMNACCPETTRRLLMRGVGRFSSVVTALYTDVENVVSLLSDLKGEWLANNREKGIPVSIVLSGLFDDVRECCRRTGSHEHTFLHSLGFFGKVEELPSEAELEIMTMCGHGLISKGRVRDMVQEIKAGLAPRDAASNIARPCVCGIVNGERAERVLRALAEA